ncbi:MAG: FKBP-type peptidyl-prolyl cis-trans isomerase [Cyclobacteriaceae bacterium]|nr:FKBP-type peptidyl-prolyl cis-trans isomerase [Cyclobacteriaceae bacterium]
MKKILYPILLVFALAACKSGPEFQKSKSGKYEFTYIKDSIGDAAKPDEILIIHLIGKDSNDSVWFDNKPMVVKKDTAAWGRGEQGFFEIFDGVSAGDSLQLTVETKLFFEESVGMPAPPEADSIPSFTFNIGVLAVVDYEGYIQYMEKMTEDKLKEEMGADYVTPEEQGAMDEKLITQYIEENGIEANRTEEGVYVAITTPGEGENATSGQTITANYTGYLLNKMYFDTSIEAVAKENELFTPGRPYEPLSFVIDEGRVIQGWHLAFKEINKGAKATIFIPSSFGYGRNRAGDMIPPNSVLIFDVEVIDIQ